MVTCALHAKGGSEDNAVASDPCAQINSVRFSQALRDRGKPLAFLDLDRRLVILGFLQCHGRGMDGVSDSGFSRIVWY